MQSKELLSFNSYADITNEYSADITNKDITELKRIRSYPTELKNDKPDFPENFHDWVLENRRSAVQTALYTFAGTAGGAMAIPGLVLKVVSSKIAIHFLIILATFMTGPAGIGVMAGIALLFAAGIAFTSLYAEYRSKRRENTIKNVIKKIELQKRNRSRHKDNEVVMVEVKRIVQGIYRGMSSHLDLQPLDSLENYNLNEPLNISELKKRVVSKKKEEDIPLIKDDEEKEEKTSRDKDEYVESYSEINNALIPETTPLLVKPISSAEFLAKHSPEEPDKLSISTLTPHFLLKPNQAASDDDINSSLHEIASPHMINHVNLKSP